ncbi:MAG: succinate dehydrogenase [Chloroflexota bacterium]|nr:succinate dehydrogenase [Chloroflexota bacterium]
MTVEARSVRDPRPGTMPGRTYWWVQPNVTALVLLLFVVYSAWSVLFGSSGHHWLAGPYLSPFYSPLLKFGWWPLSSAILVAWIPLGFRATCYYYRKAYYRAFFRDTPACASREPRNVKYTGERRFPLILNNFHRYFLYVAIVILIVLWVDTVNAFFYRGTWYIGVGSVIMLLNVAFLTLYTFSCHALRHLVGGNVNCFSCVAAGNVRHGMWSGVSKINQYHGNFAWFSLFSVAIVDIYIRLVASGVFGSGCFGAHTGC